MKLNNIKVYIASPYTIGDVGINVRKSLEVANELIDHGFIPFAPLLSHFQHMMFPRPYEDWLELDLFWLQNCDYVLRLPGESKGADAEVANAAELGIITFYSIQELLEFFNNPT